MTKTRKAVPLTVMQSIERRANNRCELCGRQLVTRVPAANKPKKELEVSLWKNFNCYSCGESNTVISLRDEVGYSISWLDREDIGRDLSRRYSFVRKSYSATVKGYYYANHCTRCGGLQGDWFITEWLVDQADEGNLVVREMVPYSGERLSVSDDMFVDEFIVPRDIHHKDVDPSNNSPENLVVLCQECHVQVHKTIGRRK